MTGDQRKRKCPIKRGQLINNRDASTSAYGPPRSSRAPTESSATADVSTDSDGNSNPSFALNSHDIAALYRVNANRPVSLENRHLNPRDNRQQISYESRPNVPEYRRLQAADSRRPTAAEQPRHIAADNRRPSASGNRRPVTAENRRSATSENRPPAASENRRPPQLETRRQAAFDSGLPSPSDFRRQGLPDNRRSNPSESRRPIRPTHADMQNNGPDSRQPPAVQAPIPVRHPLQPRGQIPQAPRPPPAPTPVTDYEALMNIFQGLSLLDRTVRKVRSNTGEFLNLLSSHVTVDSMGNFRRVEPAAIALYVVAADETGKCCNCNRDASTVCGKCRAMCYCSSFCLQRDWGNHEVQCNLETLTFVQANAQQRLRI